MFPAFGFERCFGCGGTLWLAGHILTGGVQGGIFHGDLNAFEKRMAVFMAGFADIFQAVDICG